jgi:hypothetical protein
MTDRTKELEDEIKKCNRYHLLNMKCDVISSDGKPCNEFVEPFIDFDSRSLSDNNFKWEIQRNYHTGFSCKLHGSVPININGEPRENTPEEVFGEFKQVLEAELKGRQESRKETLEEVEKNHIKKEDWIKQGLALVPVDSMIYIDNEIIFLNKICNVNNSDYKAIKDRIKQLTKLKENKEK